MRRRFGRELMVDAGPAHVAPTSQCEKGSGILILEGESFKSEKQKVKLNIKSKAIYHSRSVVCELINLF